MAMLGGECSPCCGVCGGSASGKFTDTRSGGDGVAVNSYNFPEEYVNVEFYYQAGRIPDRFTVYAGDQVFFDTGGPVRNSDTIVFPKPAGITNITVRVEGGITSGNTNWLYRISCLCGPRSNCTAISGETPKPDYRVVYNRFQGRPDEDIDAVAIEQAVRGGAVLLVEGEYTIAMGPDQIDAMNNLLSQIGTTMRVVPGNHNGAGCWGCSGKYTYCAELVNEHPLTNGLITAVYSGGASGSVTGGEPLLRVPTCPYEDDGCFGGDDVIGVAAEPLGAGYVIVRMDGNLDDCAIATIVRNARNPLP